MSARHVARFDPDERSSVFVANEYQLAKLVAFECANPELKPNRKCETANLLVNIAVVRAVLEPHKTMSIRRVKGINSQEAGPWGAEGDRRTR